MTQEQQALLDELAALVMRKVACKHPKTERDPGGNGVRCLDCGADWEMGGVYSIPTGEILDPQLANLREVLWAICPCLSEFYWCPECDPIHGNASHGDWCEHCQGTDLARQLLWQREDTPKGALAGAIQWAMTYIPPLIVWPSIFMADDLDAAALSAVIAALKARL